MTNAEAIDLLDNLIGMVEDSQDNDYDEALKMGIKALQRTANASPTHECVKPTRECISREDAIDAIKKSRFLVDAMEKVIKLPSEPVRNSEQLNGTCANCKHYTEEHLCVFWSYFGFEPNDYCSRWEGEEND